MKDWKSKYLKYKSKYLELCGIKGGNKIQLDELNTEIIIDEFINSSGNVIIDKEILELLSEAYNIDLRKFIPNSADDGKALVYKLYYKTNPINPVLPNKLVGIAVTTDMDQFKHMSDFENKGGIMNKKGLFITSVAGKSGFKGVVKILFDKIIQYSEENSIDYLLLEAKKYEPDDFLPGLYSRHGFESIIEIETETDKVGESGEPILEVGTLMCKNINSNCNCVETIIKQFENIFGKNLSGGGNKRKNKIQVIKSNDNMDLVPKNSTSKHYIKLEFPNIRVAQCEYSEGPVGLTFIDFKSGAKVHMEARGGYPGYIDCLSTHDKHMISGINIAGGSLLGLESTTGLTAEELASSNYTYFPGFNGSIIYSQNLKHNKIYADKSLGRFAYHQSDDKLYNGKAGVGVSAGHGQGWGYKQIGKIKILALCVNNAIGIVYKDNKRYHYPSWANPKKYDLDGIKLGQNTTIIVIITNLELDSDDLRQLNQQVNVSIGESIRPFNTFADGDILYTCSTLEYKKKLDIWERIKFFDECSNVLKEAILNSTK